MSRVMGTVRTILLVFSIGLAQLAFYLHGNAVEASEQVKHQQKTLAQQSGLISTLQAQDQKNRALKAAQQQREQQLRQQAESYPRKYREAIKTDECAGRRAPNAVLNLMHGTDTLATGPIVLLPPESASGQRLRAAAPRAILVATLWRYKRRLTPAPGRLPR